MLLLLSALAPVATAQVPANAGASEAAATQPGKKEKRGTFVVAPIPVSNPTFGSGLALANVYLFKMEKGDNATPASVLFAGGAYMDSKSWAAAIGAYLHLSRDRMRVLTALGAFDINYEFFGIGTDAGDAGRHARIAQDGRGAVVRWLGRVRPHLYLGGGVLGGDTSTSVARENPGVVLPPEVSLDVRLVALGLNLEHDTRDDAFFPRRGRHGEMAASFFDDAWGSERAFKRLDASYDWYLPAGERGVVAVRAAGCAASDDAPFYGLCLFGANSDLRGYAVGRYLDHRLVAGQAEYRRMLTKRWGFVAFGGVGEVAESLGDLDAESLLPAAGAGVRWRVSKAHALNLRLDVAVGKDEVVGYIGIGEAF